MKRRSKRPKVKIVRQRTIMRMARRRGRSSRTRTVYRTARRGYRSARRRGLFKGGKSGSIMSKTWEGFKNGTAYSIVAGKFAPQFSPIAQLYGEWKGGGIEGLLVNELFVNNLLGRPSALGGLGISGILSGLTGGSSGQSSGGSV